MLSDAAKNFELLKVGESWRKLAEVFKNFKLPEVAVKNCRKLAQIAGNSRKYLYLPAPASTCKLLKIAED